MIETLKCRNCDRVLRRMSLAKLRHVEIVCDHCGEWNVFEFDADNYVFKGRDAD